MKVTPPKKSTAFYVLYVVFCNLSLWAAAMVAINLRSEMLTNYDPSPMYVWSFPTFALLALFWFCEGFVAQKVERQKLVLVVRCINILFLSLFCLSVPILGQITLLDKGNSSDTAAMATGILFCRIAERLLGGDHRYGS